MSEVKVRSAQTNDEKQQHWISVRDECQNDDGKQPCGIIISIIKQPLSTVNMAIRLQYLWFSVVRNTIGIEPTSFFDVQTT
jgi:hypothetical protein